MKKGKHSVMGSTGMVPVAGQTRILNCIPSTNQEDDWTFDAATHGGVVSVAPRLPERVDLRRPWWTVRDQGTTGACVGFAVADGLLRWHLVTAGFIRTCDLVSPRFIWMANKETDGITDYPTTFIEKAGTQTKQALDVALRYGCVLKEDLPFHGGLYTGNAQQFYMRAAQMRIASYHNLGTNPDDWKAWLASQGPLLTRLDVDDAWLNAAETKGWLRKHDKKSVKGGHAVVLVGYTPKAFIVRNSWGTDWGDHGHAYASLEYAEDAFTEAYGVVLPAVAPVRAREHRTYLARSNKDADVPGGLPGPVVDIHCHVFSADDLPVEGFLRSQGVPEFLARIVDRITQTTTPDALSALETDLEGEDRATEDALHTLLRADSTLRSDYRAFLKLDQADTLPRLNDMKQISGYVKWAWLLTQGRAEITRRLIHNAPQVDLFTPLLMDMAEWVSDQPSASMEEQLNGMKKVVLSHRGMVHPFIGYDPRRDVKTHGGSLQLVKRAMQEGFTGVKLYPPLGYKPWENEDRALDSALDQLYSHCSSNGIPITTHCSPSGANVASGKLAHPNLWRPVLQRYPSLRLNLAHFGSDINLVEERRNAWAWDVARLMDAYGGVYADTGHHSVTHDERVQHGFFSQLSAMMQEFPVVKERLMFGSDWHMHVRTQQDQGFLERYTRLYSIHIGANEVAGFVGGNAVDFLGLRAGGSTRERLAGFYKKSHVDEPAWFRALGPEEMLPATAVTRRKRTVPA